jgi:hypothetical protein
MQQQPQRQPDPGIERYLAAVPGDPPTRRPRPVVEFFADRTVVRLVPGPADARIRQRGRWRAVRDRMRIVWDDDSPDTVLEVLSCSDDLLELRLRSGTLL